MNEDLDSELRATIEAEAHERARDAVHRWVESPTPQDRREMVDAALGHAGAEHQLVSPTDEEHLDRLAAMLEYAGRMRRWGASVRQ